ncbi:Xyloglucan endotransglucosylase/hydrolase [Rhynchospora pubera]|uniref:Xyloglucan endotransglucosylase/hydrolase n=1 Tax=Rhynchospora pubera TaxID=906938 RepID=A0AAV8EVU0_9POAL|nr:Xyloglucan endotransglucosylase/hydrolase [Rhynchospora pubera]KAJ4785302.1 Xyloglucan endotransglucosylase/hydrolase [Rhynchospora pubera]KAJ4806035.1 Xyloglucan endotransglucosylase/hydrolase [Rhynchospora pubera]
MSLALLISLLLLSFHLSNAQPNPGYYPSYRFKSSQFYRAFNNLWGPQHQSVTGDQSSVTIWLDRNSGSGFKSRHPFISGYFGASIKLQPGYTAGVITAFYLSNNQAHPGFHDEVDIEFLGTTPGKPYTLQTNVYIRGSGDGRIIGREMKFHLWFDPTAAFHNYAISWSPYEIIFFVDDIPIRRYPKKSANTFPLRPMWLYGSIWDASSWATDNGKYKADYRYQPFVARFTKFIVRGCSPWSPRRCRGAPSSPSGGGLSNRQYMAMHWAQSRYMVYNYCRDPKRDHSLTPECWS